MAAVRKIDNLQILRAIAAFLVVADHSIKVSFGLSHARLMFVAWRAGEIGVAIFFVISGFIMVYTSGKYFGSHTGPLLFMKKRVQRLVPLYWVCVVFALLIFPANTGGMLPYTFERLVKSWFFIPYNDDGVLPIHPVLGVGWTLNYEMAFYLVFAACLVLPRKFAVPACVAALLAVVAAGSVAHGLPHRPSNMFEFWTNPIILLFPAGMLIASIKEREGPVRNSAMLFAPVLVTLIGTMFLLKVTSPLPQIWHLITWIVCMVYVAATALLGRDAAKDTPINRSLIILGDASYSTYLTHPFVLLAMSGLRVSDELGSVATFVLCMLLSHVGGWLCYRHIERRLMRFFKQRSQPLLGGATAAV